MRQEKKYFERKKEEDLDAVNTFEKNRKAKKENFKVLRKKLQIAMTPEKLKWQLNLMMENQLALNLLLLRKKM